MEASISSSFPDRSETEEDDIDNDNFNDDDGDNSASDTEEDESDQNQRNLQNQDRFGGDDEKFPAILASLMDGNAGSDTHLVALTELCDFLSFSSDFVLTGLMLESLAPILAALAKNESNPDIMLLAIRAITYLCDAFPRSARFLVQNDVVSALCARLIAIKYLDLAEQCLLALEKISHNHPVECLQAGTIMAVLNYIDFFSISIQRVALSTVVNICKKLPSECSSQFMEAVPVLCNLLQYEDQKLVENVATCLIRIVDHVSHSSEMLNELCNNGLIQQVMSLIAMNNGTTLSQPIYTGLIGLLSRLASGSAVAVTSIFELNITSTLKHMLSSYDISHSIAYSLVGGDVQSDQLTTNTMTIEELMPLRAQEYISGTIGLTFFMIGMKILPVFKFERIDDPLEKITTAEANRMLIDFYNSSQYYYAIVEGAYAWGFNIRSWQRHLNPLTWPEILRQFALSAGFGPKLKKRSLERTYFRDDNEGHDCEDIVSTLRNGAAAENAAAVMQEKGFSHPRRSRNRLTPGTVKFAAFHVLSLEGSKGLTILEVADRIQKSGLRDLTTSKTPEASIAAALSRDANLFERTAPSTYCVLPAFRRDPADAEAILSAAREKIQIFESGFSDSEAEKDAEDADDVERDDDSECDVGEDPEVDVGGTIEHGNKEVSPSKGAQAIVFSGNGNRETLCNEIGETPCGDLVNAGEGFSLILLEGSKEINSSGATVDHSIDVTGNCNEASLPDQEDTEIDESYSGEPWVQGLMEGEYSDLSVEERLNSLVALIGVAIEGNSIRVILEERLEAANSLKKQMWAEAQLDKRRMKEEYATKSQYSSYMGIKAEQNPTSFVVDGNQSPFGVDNKNNDTSPNPAVKQEAILDPPIAPNFLNNLGQDFSAGPDNLPQQHGYAAEKSRSQLKSYIGHKAEEMYVYRSLPLGQDRRRNRYWQFVTSASRNDPGSGRIFFESQSGFWRLIDSEEAFDALLASLDTRGIREAHLHSMLQKVEMSFKDAVRRNLNCTSVVDSAGVTVKTKASDVVSSPDGTEQIESPNSTLCDRSLSFRIELGRTEIEKNNSLKRYQDFQNWMWKECFNSSILCAMKLGKKRCIELLVTCDFCYNSYFSEDNHCPVCHTTFGTFVNKSFSDHVNQCEEKHKVDPSWNFHGSNSSLPPRIRLLKAQLALIEVSVPPEALQPHWTKDYRKSWGVRLHSSSSSEDLLQFITILEGTIKPDCLSSNFETTKELLGSSVPQGCAVDFPGLVPVLPWVPQTTAAVALRLMELDASICYMLHQKMESHKDKESDEFIKLPSRYTVTKNIQEVEPAETPDHFDYLQKENWIDLGSGRSSSGRGRGGRGRGRGRSRGGRRLGVSSSRLEITGNSEKLGHGIGRKGRTRGRGRKRGRRTIRSKQRPGKRMVEKETDLGHFNVTVVPKQQVSGGESPRSSGGMEWVGEPRMIHMGGDNSVEASESDDNGQATGDEYDEGGADYVGIFNGKSEDLMEESDEDGDGDGDDDGDDDEVDGDGDEEGDVDGDMDGDLEGEVNMNDDGEDDEGMASMSTDYSD